MPDTESRPLIIKSVLSIESEKARFEALVEASGFSKAEYIRRCCLDSNVMVVTDQNLRVYAELGALQVLLKKVAQQNPLTDLSAAINQVQTLRLSLVGLLEVADETEHPTS